MVAHGDFTMLLPDHPFVYAFTRRLDADALLVLCNVSGSEQPVDVRDVGAAWRTSELVLGNVDYPPTDVLADLRPWEARVLRAAGTTVTS